MKWILSIHRVLGTILSLFLLMWFVSGMVMLYHDFPKVYDKEIPYLPALTTADLEQIPQVLERSPSLTTLELYSHLGRSALKVGDSEGVRVIEARSGAELLKPISLEEARQHVEEQWQVPIKREKVMERLDVWTPFPAHLNHLPLYHFVLEDQDGTELYYSSQTGDLLQYTTRVERFWGWLGPIPHYLYITPIRQNQKLWIHTIEWIAGLGSLMCLTGLIVGCVMYYKVWRHKRKLRTPYRRPYYLKWHHIFGMLGGLFAFLFILSGALSFGNMPALLRMKPQNEPALSQSLRAMEELPTITLQGDMQKLLETFPSKVKKLALCAFNGQAYYRTTTNEGEAYYRVQDGKVIRYQLTTDEVEQYLQSLQLPYSYTLTLQDHYDSYYSPRKGRPLELPIYKVSLSDPDETRIYIQPHSGNRIVRDAIWYANSWVYPRLHTFRFGSFLNNHPSVRRGLIWVMLLAGTVISITGVQLSVRYIRRKFRL